MKLWRMLFCLKNLKLSQSLFSRFFMQPWQTRHPSDRRGYNATVGWICLAKSGRVAGLSQPGHSAPVSVSVTRTPALFEFTRRFGYGLARNLQQCTHATRQCQRRCCHEGFRNDTNHQISVARSHAVGTRRWLWRRKCRVVGTVGTRASPNGCRRSSGSQVGS